MSLEKLKIEARPQNWLPLPQHVVEEEEQQVDEDDFFPKGEVLVFYPRQGKGSIKDSRGAEIPFSLTDVELIGRKNSVQYILPGKRIGYDVARTEGGTRVTKIKVY
jgi:cold shock CspA family protein